VTITGVEALPRFPAESSPRTCMWSSRVTVTFVHAVPMWFRRERAFRRPGSRRSSGRRCLRLQTSLDPERILVRRREVGRRRNGMKSALGSPLSAPQSTVSDLASEIASRNPGSESLGVRSAQKAPDCQPGSRGSSKSRKLK
jgi:hypothetical protein